MDRNLNTAIHRFTIAVTQIYQCAGDALFRAFKGLLSSDDLKSMAQIVSAADPAWLATKKAMADTAAEAAMEKTAVDSRPDSERKAGAEAVARYEAAKKAEKVPEEPKKA